MDGSGPTRTSPKFLGGYGFPPSRALMVTLLVLIAILAMMVLTQDSSAAEPLAVSTSKSTCDGCHDDKFIMKLKIVSYTAPSVIDNETRDASIVVSVTANEQLWDPYDQRWFGWNMTVDARSERGLFEVSGSPFRFRDRSPDLSPTKVSFTIKGLVHGRDTLILRARLLPWHNTTDTARTLLVRITIDVWLNAPPVCTVPVNHTAVEDVPLILDFAPFVTDEDNSLDQLILATSSPYATSFGLNLTMTFPEGVLVHDLDVEVSDFLNNTKVHLHFEITAVDDPPTVEYLELFNAIEDRVSIFNLSFYLADVDTPLSDLTVNTTSPYCVVHGHELHLLFDRDGPNIRLNITVSDGTSNVSTTLPVHIVEVNDPPVITGSLQFNVTEEEETVLDISPFIYDEDTSHENLSLEALDAHITRVEGLSITFLYMTSLPPQAINVTIIDASIRIGSSLNISIIAVNDGVEVRGIDGLGAPYSVSVDEGQEVRLVLNASDEDGDVIDYTVVSDWEGVDIHPNGTIEIVAPGGDVGNFNATFVASDLNGSQVATNLSIEVLNVNDPPTTPVVLAPENGTSVEEGDNVTFSVDLYDPDLVLGQVLMVTWRSNRSGIVMSLTTEEDLSFTIDWLEVGTHNITISVNDGPYSASTWITVEVRERYVPPDPEPEPEPEPEPRSEPEVNDSPGIGVAGIALALTVASLLAFGKGSRRH